MKAVRVALALALGAVLGCDADLERMIHQPRYRSYQATRAFEDGMVMRTPPPGAIDRNRQAPSLTTDGRDAHGEAQRIPVTVTRELVLHGQNRFDTFCAPCHGVLGDGKSEVARRMTLRPPPSLLDPRIRDMAPGAIFRVVSEGYGLMRSYAPQLAPGDRWAVIAYLRALQASQGVKLSELPADLQEEAKPWLK